jgi:DNA-directed RNA polymerase subunit RPC12/RpoP
MAIRARCGGCGAEFDLNDELAGRSLRCPRCQTVIEVGERLDELAVSYDEGLPGAFRHDKFLFRQKVLAINEKDEPQGGALITFFVRHRRHFELRSGRIGFVLAIWAGYQVLLGFTSPIVDNRAHIGGLAGGSRWGWRCGPPSSSAGPRPWPIL